MPLLETFGLQRDPFLDTADPSFFYETMATANARRRLMDCLAAGRGLAVVLGPIGVGKTTLCNAVQAELLADDRFLVGLMLDPVFESEGEFLAAIASSFGAASASNDSVRAIKESLKARLFELGVGNGKQPILFIDEAQLLDPRHLESLRLLLNYQIDERKLLSMALAGQMELRAAVVGRPNFADRIALMLELKPLTQSEAGGLLDHRLRSAGYSAARSPFDDAALRDVWRLSGGLPRRLTALAREAMEAAAELRRTNVTPADVAQAVERIAPVAEGPRAPMTATADRRPWWAFWHAS